MTLKDTLIASIVPIFLGFGFVIAKPAMEELPPFLLMGLRFTIAALILIWWFPIPKKLLKNLFIVSLIGGTLTYEDVTSIDSVGLITARSGLDLGTSNIVRLEGATATKTSTASAMIDSFSSSTYQSASYQVQVRRGDDYHTTSINLVHANSAVYISEYGTVITNESLATFDADIDSGNVRLKAAPTSSDSTVFKIFRTVMNS